MTRRGYVVLVMLIISFPFYQVGSATPCPIIGGASLSLVSGTSYFFANCTVPVIASGTDISNITMTFINATPGGISLQGSFVYNFTLRVVNSYFAVNITLLFVRVGSVDHLVVEIKQSTVNAASIMECDRLIGDDAVAKNVSILLMESTVICTNFFAAIFGPGLLVNGLNLLLLRTAITSGDSILVVQFYVEPSLPSSLQNVVIHAENSSIRAESTTFIVKYAHGIVRDISVAFINTSVMTTQLLWIPFDGTNGSAAHISVFAIRSTINISSAEHNGEFLGVRKAWSLQHVSVGIFSSCIAADYTLIAVSYVTSIGDIDVLFENSTIHAAFSVFSVSFIRAIEGGGLGIIARNGTMVSLSTSEQLVSVFCSILSVQELRAPVRLLILTSSVAIDVNCFLGYYPIFMQLAGISSFDRPANGSFVAIILNSTVAIHSRQKEPMFCLDSCSILSMTAVDTAPATAGCILLYVDNQSRISVACAALASLVSVQQSSGISFSFFAAGDTQLTITTTLGTQRQKLPFFKSILGPIAGSFVLYLVNAIVTNASVSIANCTITCGELCQISGGGFSEDSIFYNQTLNMTLGYIPPSIVNPKVVNITILLRNTSVATASTAAAMPLQLRSLFSLGNMTGARIILEGPIRIPTGLFDGILGDAGRQEIILLRNRVQIINCETIQQVTPQSSIHGAKLASFLMAEGERIGSTILTTRQSRGGTCMLTTTASQTSTLSKSPTVTKTLPTPSVSTEIHGPDAENLPSTIASLRTASTAAMISCLPLAMFDPLAGAELQQAALVLLVAGCGSGVDGKPLPRAWSPLQLAVGDDGQTKYLVGAAIGNMVVLLCFLLLAAGLSLLVAVAKRDRGHLGQSLRRKLFAAAERLNLPGWLMCPIMFLLQPTVACSVAAMASGTAAGITSGIVALAFLSFVLAGPVLLVTRYRGHLHSKPRPDAARSKLLAFCVGYRWWQLTGLGEVRTGHVGRLTMRYGPRTPWYFCVNLAMSVAFGVCGSAQLAQHGCSLPVKIAVFVVLLSSFAGKVVLRPYASHLRNGTNILSDGLCVVSVLLTLVLPGSVHVSETLALVAVYVVCGAQLGSMCVAAMAGKLGALSSCSSGRTGHLTASHASSCTPAQQQAALHALLLIVCVKQAATDRILLGVGMERTLLQRFKVESTTKHPFVHPVGSFAAGIL